MKQVFTIVVEIDDDGRPWEKEEIEEEFDAWLPTWNILDIQMGEDKPVRKSRV